LLVPYPSAICRTWFDTVTEFAVAGILTGENSMNRKLKVSLFAHFTIAASLLFAGVANAAPPASVWGTWSLTANQTLETLVITAQGNLATPCKVIIGTIGGAAAPVYGFYCPDTGRIHFIHKNLSTKVPMRVFDGIVSDVLVGSPNRISGTYTSDYSSVLPFGYYGFSATK
jgi:hypothetical protein